MARIFRYTERILTKLDPLESPRSQLSNESNFVKDPVTRYIKRYEPFEIENDQLFS